MGTQIELTEEQGATVGDDGSAQAGALASRPSTSFKNGSGSGTRCPCTPARVATKPATGGGQPLPALVVNDVLLTALGDLLQRALESGVDTLTTADLVSGPGALQDNGDGTWTFTPALADQSAVLFIYR